MTLSDLGFVWTTDLDGDGTPETARISTAIWVPDIDRPDGGRDVRAETVQTLALDAVTVLQTRESKSDHRGPGRFTLSWPFIDEDLLAILEEDYATGRVCDVRLDHRWRQLRVTSSGAADRTVTVEAGYRWDGDDTAWLRTDASHVCGATHTRVYVTASGGVLTVASNTSVPAGATQLAVISVAGDVVTVVTSPSGTANARRGRIVEFRPRQVPGGQTGLELVFQEARY